MFTCHICEKHFRSCKMYCSHYQYHTNISSIRFPCGFVDCNRSFKTYKGFVAHIERDHSLEREKNITLYAENRVSSLKCTLSSCNETFLDSSLLLSHLKLHLRCNYTVKCPFKDCSFSLKKLSSFTSHLSRNHKNHDLTSLNQIENAKKSVGLQKQTEEIFVCNESSIDDFANPNLKPLNALDTVDTSDYHIFLKNLGLFYLKLQSTYNVPGHVLQLIHEEFTKCHGLSTDLLYKNISAKFSLLHIGEDIIPPLLDDVKESDIFNKAQKVLSSDYFRKKYFQEYFNYVPPITIALGMNDNRKPCYYHYVPIKQSILNLLTDEAVKLNTTSSFSENVVLKDITDGSTFRENPFFSQNVPAFKIILYQDSFEIVNPLGSARCKHKILAVYMTLGDIQQHHRSKVNPIQLVLLVKEKDFKYFGQKQVFSVLMRDLKSIEIDGIEINDSKIKGTVLYIIGDNLGSHGIGGFSENFSKGNICRFCTISKDEFTKNPHGKSESKMTVTKYNDVIKKLSEPNCDKAELNGIKFDSVFNQLQGFHVCNPGLPPCIGHDLFEGVVSYDLSLYISYFVKEKWFSYSFLNYQLENFSYKGEDATNKPVILKNKDKLGGHAVQNWCFLRFFTAFILEKIPNFENDVFHQVYLLQEIILLVCSKAISRSQVFYLEDLIREYIFYRKRLFPDVPLRPKHHFLTHYPELILKCGPLIFLWTLRFESKHVFFKKCIGQARNFKNVTATMSERHQLFQAYLKSGSYFGPDIELIKSMPYEPLCYSSEIHKILQQSSLNISCTHVAQKIIIHCTEFKAGEAVILDVNMYSVNVGIIKMVFFDGQKSCFAIEDAVAEKIPMSHLYVIHKAQTLSCVSNDSILGPPLSIYDVCDKKVIILKHNIFYRFMQ